MRITNNMMITNLMYNLERNLNVMSRRQDELSTGKKILRASDNPIEASKILKYKTDISELDQFARNTNDAMSWLEVTESSVADTGTVLQRMRELSVQAVNGTYSADDTEKIAKEILNLKKQLISNGNFNFAGRYIFSGTQTDKPLFNDDGTFNINVTSKDLVDPQKTLYQIGIGEDITVNTPGIDVFGYEQVTSVMTTAFPDGLQEGTPATKSVLTSGLNLGANFSTLNPLTASIVVAVNGTSYTLDDAIELPTNNKSLLDLNGTTKPFSTENLINLLKLADDGAGNKLGSVADIYLNAGGEITIKDRLYSTSAITTTFNGGTDIGFNLATLTSTAGAPSTNATVTGATILTDYAGVANQNFEVSVNGVIKTINIGATIPTTEAELTTALNASLDAAFGAAPRQVEATFTAGVLSFSTLNQPNDGTVPTLEVRVTQAVESSLIRDVNNFITALQTGDPTGISNFLGLIDVHLNRALSVRADIGARMNRMELVGNRITDNNVSFTRMLSNSQDADMAETVMYLKNAENVYKASLNTGARVIQPNLIDFLR